MPPHENIFSSAKETLLQIRLAGLRVSGLALSAWTFSTYRRGQSY